MTWTFQRPFLALNLDECHKKGISFKQLMLQNNVIVFSCEHWSGCCTTEHGYARDIGAIEIWLIDCTPFHELMKIKLPGQSVNVLFAQLESKWIFEKRKGGRRDRLAGCHSSSSTCTVSVRQSTSSSELYSGIIVVSEDMLLINSTWSDQHHDPTGTWSVLTSTQHWADIGSIILRIMPCLIGNLEVTNC